MATHAGYRTTMRIRRVRGRVDFDMRPAARRGKHTYACRTRVRGDDARLAHLPLECRRHRAPGPLAAALLVKVTVRVAERDSRARDDGDES